MIRTGAGLAGALILALQPTTGQTRPVSYTGGLTAMQRTNSLYASLHLHYSPTFQGSVGVYAETNWSSDWRYGGVQYNRLVKRWNNPDSQGNFYVNASVGASEPFDGGAQNLAGFAGAAADWETRRLFVSYQARALGLGFDQDVRQSARVGVAPYVGDYGDLHTWFMLEAVHAPEADAPLTLTPLARFFYGVQLVEVGYTPETERYLANWVVRF